MRSLSGRVVAITGGARGIGYSIAEQLRRDGARVALGDIDADAVREAGERLGAAAAVPLDVTDPGSFAAFLAAVTEQAGPVDVLINNAGIMPVGRFTAESDDITRRILEVNVLGVMHGTKAALPAMVARGGGHIINIASLAGENPTPGMATYCASKQAVLGFTETMRLEYRGTGVHFSAVLPTFTRTELIAGTKAPMGLLAEPEDVARAVARLIARPRRRVTVTRLAGVAMAFNKLTPRAFGEFTARRMGVHRIFTDEVDTAARADYDRRVRGSREHQ
ncbi:putative oxidoreductase, SDR family [Nocardia nova SH22a]|uniref:Putative oxidoreductase, SDR family n=1 Tax=Nocardia nova SH22a TaxID=1415166 RepID=W5TC14_9NOCA|nr:SDR family oxidoreductase [Nocardia nova]AHH16724.1 putative oxidoreductase, SDR family [Nocardia nova SH22a]